MPRTPWLALVLAPLAAACSGTPAPADATVDAPLDADAAPESSTDAAVTTVPDAHGCVRTRSPRDAGAPDASLPDASALACNGSPALCDRRYDQVAYPTTHNAMSNADEHWTAPNQHHGIARQLDDGIRALMLDTHPYRNDAYLCHEFCGLGNLRLAAGLCQITQFLDANPGEVVSIIFESYISAELTAAHFAESGLSDYVHTHARGTPWPTLRELIARDERMVVFTDSGGGAPAWYHPVWDHAFETPYAFATPADFTCAMNRGMAGNPLFILNHFLTNPLASPDFAEMANHNPLFIDRARQCQDTYHQIPNFVTVDFYDIGDIFAVTRALNSL